MQRNSNSRETGALGTELCGRIWLATGLLAALVASPAAGQVNSWLKPASGSWEEMQWSLGTLPGPGQSVVITNTGWKAVMLSANTAQNYPGTLTVDSLTLSSPADTENALLLNYAGLQQPLTVKAFTVSSNSIVTMLGSGLALNGPNGAGMSIGGEFNQDAFSSVTGNQMDIGYIGPGVYNLISGTLSVGNAWVGGPFQGVCNQTGGTNVAGIMHLDGGTYNLSAGDFAADAYFTSGLFHQLGGIVTSGLGVWRGSYVLENGVIYGGLLVPAFDGYSVSSGSASAIQTGGTNLAAVDVGEFGYGSYTLSNGVALLPGLTVWARGSFQQWSGTLVVTGQLSVASDYVARDVFGYGAYGLAGGSMASDSLLVEGHLNQSAGTNVVAGDLTMSGPCGDVEVSGGELSAANVVAEASWVGGFSQSGGRMVIGGDLTVGGNGLPFWRGFTLSGGEMEVSNIVLAAGSSFTWTGGVLNQSGALDILAAEVYVGGGTNGFGAAQLQAGGSGQTNSTLHLPAGGRCLVNFRDSSALFWSNAATLTIANWSGSWVGGGDQQVRFGSSSNGLSQVQAQQVLFDRPAGFTPAVYHAKILATGEVVPDAVPPTGHFQPLLSLARQTDGTIQVTVRGEAGADYRLEVSSDVASWTNWTSMTAPSGVFSMVDAEATNHPARFYRALLLPP